MSTKLNAEELAANRWPESGPTVAHAVNDDAKREGYAAAIREVSQPLAEERDELRAICEALIRQQDWAIANTDSPVSATINYGHVAHEARAVLAKYPKQ